MSCNCKKKTPQPPKPQDTSKEKPAQEQDKK